MKCMWVFLEDFSYFDIQNLNTKNSTLEKNITQLREAMGKVTVDATVIEKKKKTVDAIKSEMENASKELKSVQEDFKKAAQAADRVYKELLGVCLMR